MMKEPSEYLTIGQMAAYNHVSRKKLMVYEQKGLLIPEKVNPETGYRYYSIKQCASLDLILQLQQFGMGLSRIRLLQEKGLSSFMEALRESRKYLERRIDTLSICISTIDELLSTCETRLNPPPIDVPALEWLNRRRVLKYDVPPYLVGKPRDEDVAPLYNWETSLRNVKAQLIRENLPLSLFHNVGGIISRASMEAGEPVCTGAYVFNPQCLGEREEYWEAGWYLTATISNMFDPDGSHRELRLLMELLKIAQEEGYAVTGDYFSEILAESPALSYEGRDMMLRLRLPVAVKDPLASPYYRPVQTEIKV